MDTLGQREVDFDEKHPQNAFSTPLWSLFEAAPSPFLSNHFFQKQIIKSTS